DENDDLKERVSTYQNEANNYSIENSELKETEHKLRETIKFKEAELEEFKALNEKQSLEEKNTMEKKINSLEIELQDALKKKETYRLRNKDINFQLQNYKYKVLDLEKKLIDTQFNLAVEKRDKNPLLR
ncbi:cell division protein ZapA, partial [Clostridium saudiense]|nr:cell division protein ZapA [Clostridium saudiense]